MEPSRQHRTRHEGLGHARFLTFSCYQRLPILVEAPVCEAFCHHLADARAMLSFKLFAWVVMPEHVHLLILPTPDQEIAAILRKLKEPVARSILARWRKNNTPILNQLVDSRGHTHFWQRGGGYDRNIYSDKELFEKIEYIHANPVKRGLVTRTTDWPWSSARWFAGEREGTVPIDSIR